MPGELVEGVGAATEPVPPVACSYHNKLEPVALSGTAVSYWQYLMSVAFTAGDVDVCLTVMVFVITSLPHPALDADSVTV